MKDIRLILTIGGQDFLMPDDVDIAATVESLQGFQLVENRTYGLEPEYRIAGTARTSIAIVPASAIREKAAPRDLPPFLAESPVPAEPRPQVADEDMPL